MNRKAFTIGLIVIGVLVAILAINRTSFSQSGSSGTDPATQESSSGAVVWQPKIDFTEAFLTVIDPQGNQMQKPFAAGEAITFPLVDADGNALADGTYHYRLQFSPVLSPRAQATISAAGESQDRDPAILDDLRAVGELPNTDLVQSGKFIILNGELARGDQEEESGAQEGSGEQRAPDQVINEDLTVYGDLMVQYTGAGGNIYSANQCIGFECNVGSENFGLDNLRFKENVLRIHFDDVSNTGAFPNDDWRIIINDSYSGGEEYFAVEAIEQPGDNSTVPFKIMGGADTDALVVAGNGNVGHSKNVGVGTLTPNTHLHIYEDDTPTLRLEQYQNQWPAQTWDLGGNEANFFLRDVTYGSKLPIRIAPNSQTNSIFANANGVAIAPGYNNENNDTTDDPEVNATLHVYNSDPTFRVQKYDNSTGAGIITLDLDSSGNMVLAGGLDAGGDVSTSGDLEVAGNTVLSGSLQVDNTNTGVTTFSLDDSGNLVLSGLLTEGSDKFSKENFAPVDRTAVLDRLMDIPISTWNYTADTDAVRHMGPMAQDFYAAYGLGVDGKHLAPLDVNGVTLAGMQELYSLVQTKDVRIGELESQLDQLEVENASLEQRLSDLEAAVAALLAAQGE